MIIDLVDVVIYYFNKVYIDYYYCCECGVVFYSEVVDLCIGILMVVVNVCCVL